MLGRVPEPERENALPGRVAEEVPQGVPEGWLEAKFGLPVGVLVQLVHRLGG
jgi:hypothetical protein